VRNLQAASDGTTSDWHQSTRPFPQHLGLSPDQYFTQAGVVAVSNGVVCPVTSDVVQDPRCTLYVLTRM
jgi:hypothetical protein